MKKEEPLLMRLHFQAHLYELARLVGYAGVPEATLRETVQPLVAAHGRPKMAAAAHELTRTDDKTRLVTLRPDVRKLCWGILGPAPDHPDYDFIKHGPVLAFKEDIEKWKKDFAAKKAAEAEKEKPPEPVKDVKPKPREAKAKPPDPPPVPDPRKDDQEEPAPALDGISPAGYAADAKRRNNRQLHCMLRDARRKFKRHGKRSFAGKEAKKALAAAEAEFCSRGLALPPVGEETAKWDKAK